MLVYREERKSIFDGAEGVGPGAYLNNSRTRKPAKAVTDVGFLSRVERERQSLNNTVFPGPGHYCASAVSEVQQSSYTQSSIFRSKVERFGEEKSNDNANQSADRSSELRLMNATEASDAVSDSKPSCRRLHPQKKSTSRQPLAPSIPCRQEGYGYRVDESGRLQPNKSPAQMVDRKDRSVGPGSYNLMRMQFRMSGCGWSNSKVKREVFQAKPLLTKHTLLPSCTTLQETIGCYWSQLPRQPAAVQRCELIKDSMRRKFGRLYQQEADRLEQTLQRLSQTKENLGPGAYLPDETNRPPLKEKPQHFFLSAPRYKDASKSLEKSVPLPKKQEPVRYEWKGPEVGSLARANRFANRRQEGPGPGAYQASSVTRNKHAVFSFGKALRETGCNATQSPGPSDYQVTLPSVAKHVVKYDCPQHHSIRESTTEESTLPKPQQRLLNESISSHAPFGSTVERTCNETILKEPAPDEPSIRSSPNRHYHGHLFKSIRKTHLRQKEKDESNALGPGVNFSLTKTYSPSSSLIHQSFNVTIEPPQQ